MVSHDLPLAKSERIFSLGRTPYEQWECSMSDPRLEIDALIQRIEDEIRQLEERLGVLQDDKALFTRAKARAATLFPEESQASLFGTSADASGLTANEVFLLQAMADRGMWKLTDLVRKGIEIGFLASGQKHGKRLNMTLQNLRKKNLASWDKSGAWEIMELGSAAIARDDTKEAEDSAQTSSSASSH